MYKDTTLLIVAEGHLLKPLQGQLKEAKKQSNVRPQVLQRHAMHCESESSEIQSFYSAGCEGLRHRSERESCGTGQLAGDFPSSSKTVMRRLCN